jgi:hypothetical protein
LVQIKVATCGDLWFCPKMISIMFPTWLIKTRYGMSWTLLMGFQMFFYNIIGLKNEGHEHTCIQHRSLANQMNFTHCQPRFPYREESATRLAKPSLPSS